MADDRIRMPSSMGGLVRYFDEYRSRISFKPGNIVVITIVVIILMLVLHAWGSGLI